MFFISVLHIFSIVYSCVFLNFVDDIYRKTVNIGIFVLHLVSVLNFLISFINFVQFILWIFLRRYHIKYKRYNYVSSFLIVKIFHFSFLIALAKISTMMMNNYTIFLIMFLALIGLFHSLKC